MFRRRKLKQKTKRLCSNKARRILHIHKLKRRIAGRQRIGFMMLHQQ
ncbi:hypothetical protein [Glaesserella sp.]